MAAPFAGELQFDIPDGATEVNPAPTDNRSTPPYRGTARSASNIGAFSSSPSIAGASSTTVTGTNFGAAAEIIFHPDESAITNSQIVATSTATTLAGTASTIVTLPDGTVMTLVGVVAVTPVLFTP